MFLWLFHIVLRQDEHVVVTTESRKTDKSPDYFLNEALSQENCSGNEIMELN